MIIEPDFLDHWKTQMLVQISNNDAAPLWVLRLWAHCQNRKSHVFLNFPPEALKAVCRFPDHANKLESWLITSGFIRKEESKLIVHQWDEYNAKLFANWENGKLGGRPKEKPTNNPTITHGLPNDNPLITDRVDRVEDNREREPEVNLTNIESCKLMAVKLGMPESEGEAFFHHYQGIGWVTGTGQPVVDRYSVLQKWKGRYERNQVGRSMKPNNSMKFKWQATKAIQALNDEIAKMKGSWSHKVVIDKPPGYEFKPESLEKFAQMNAQIDDLQKLRPTLAD